MAFLGGELCAKQVVFALPNAEPACPGHAPDRQLPNLDKNHGFHYTFHQQTALQNDLSGRVPQSPEKRFPINYHSVGVSIVNTSPYTSSK